MSNKKSAHKGAQEKKAEETLKEEAPTEIEAKASEAIEENEKVTSEDALEVAQAEIAELKDKLLRMHADMDNLRKRSAREIEDARKFAVEKFSTALLDVVDNLERALEAEEGNEAGLREGVKLTFDSWHTMMDRFELKRIDAVGETFDPHLHEALSKMPSDEPEGTVIAQHVAGYTLHGRLIRAAKVLISSGPT
ncbi:MAG: nucleotide exchange factor GrpE [Mariprofundaceae bacterium]